ncbi:MAG: hypothetical protein EKK61_02360 [Rickettsiales bacterium]|nr:MAG: hypothetical protein EKK61_02360 [Rickettsiales bacterium]
MQISIGENGISQIVTFNKGDTLGTILLRFLKCQNVNSIDEASKYFPKIVGNGSSPIVPIGEAQIILIKEEEACANRIHEFKESLKMSFKKLSKYKALPDFESKKNDYQDLINTLKDYYVDLLSYLREINDHLAKDFINFYKENELLSSNDVKLEEQDGSNQLMIEEHSDIPLIGSTTADEV